MTELKQRLGVDQEIDVAQYTDATSGVVTALDAVGKSTIALTAATAVQGIVSSGFAQALWLINATGAPISLQNNNAGASAANRILTGLGANLTIPTDGEVLLQYDPTALRWRVAGSGAQGPQGSQGLQGSTGAQGAQGFQGLQGSTGAQGAQGFQGLQGSTGAQGAQGFQGLQGSTGAQGAQGFQGFQGLQGSTGAQGAQGFQGNQGFQGFQGAVPVSSPNDSTNATYVGSGQYPASAGATATNSQASHVTVASTSIIMFAVWVGSAGTSSWFLGVADYASADISTISDITGLCLLSASGTGIYVSKSANSNQITFQNLNLGSVQVIVQFFNAAITGTSVWA